MKKIFCQFISLLFTSMLVANAENFNFTSAAGIDSFSRLQNFATKIKNFQVETGIINILKKVIGQEQNLKLI